MRRGLLLYLAVWLVVPLGVCAAGEGKGEAVEHPLRVLFIGNSYIYTNNLPQLFVSLARSGGHTVRVMRSAQPGWRLEQHVRSRETVSVIERHAWDYVILQEQSVIPVLLRDRRWRMYPAVRALHERIRRRGAKTILFMTWGRRDGLAKIGYPSYAAMQNAVRDGYMRIADELGVMVAPVGEAWRKAVQRNPRVPLWGGDGSHPSRTGSYLAGCVFYAVIFQESPEGLSYRGGLPPETARFLQSIAASTVLDRRRRWNISAKTMSGGR